MVSKPTPSLLSQSPPLSMQESLLENSGRLQEEVLPLSYFRAMQPMRRRKVRRKRTRRRMRRTDWMIETMRIWRERKYFIARMIRRARIARIMRVISFVKELANTNTFMTSQSIFNPELEQEYSPQNLQTTILMIISTAKNASNAQQNGSAPSIVLENTNNTTYTTNSIAHNLRQYSCVMSIIAACLTFHSVFITHIEFSLIAISSLSSALRSSTFGSEIIRYCFTFCRYELMQVTRKSRMRMNSPNITTMIKQATVQGWPDRMSLYIVRCHYQFQIMEVKATRELRKVSKFMRGGREGMRGQDWFDGRMYMPATRSLLLKSCRLTALPNITNVIITARNGNKSSIASKNALSRCDSFSSNTFPSNSLNSLMHISDIAYPVSPVDCSQIYIPRTIFQMQSTTLMRTTARSRPSMIRVTLSWEAMPVEQQLWRRRVSQTRLKITQMPQARPRLRFWRGLREQRSRQTMLTWVRITRWKKHLLRKLKLQYFDTQCNTTFGLPPPAPAAYFETVITPTPAPAPPALVFSSSTISTLSTTLGCSSSSSIIFSLGFIVLSTFDTPICVASNCLLFCTVFAGAFSKSSYSNANSKFIKTSGPTIINDAKNRKVSSRLKQSLCMKVVPDQFMVRMSWNIVRNESNRLLKLEKPQVSYSVRDQRGCGGRLNCRGLAQKVLAAQGREPQIMGLRAGQSPTGQGVGRHLYSISPMNSCMAASEYKKHISNIPKAPFHSPIIALNILCSVCASLPCTQNINNNLTGLNAPITVCNGSSKLRQKPSVSTILTICRAIHGLISQFVQQPRINNRTTNNPVMTSMTSIQPYSMVCLELTRLEQMQYMSQIRVLVRVRDRGYGLEGEGKGVEVFVRVIGLRGLAGWWEPLMARPRTGFDFNWNFLEVIQPQDRRSQDMSFFSMQTGAGMVTCLLLLNICLWLDFQIYAISIIRIIEVNSSTHQIPFVKRVTPPQNPTIQLFFLPIHTFPSIHPPSPLIFLKLLQQWPASSPVFPATPKPPTSSHQQARSLPKKSPYEISLEEGRTVTTAFLQQNEEEEEISRRVDRLKKKYLAERKPIEQEFIKKNLGTSPIMYLVENKWCQQYTEFLSNPSKTTLRQINNHVLLQGKHLAPNLREKIDYYPVTQKTWYFLKRMYGGGPQLQKHLCLPSTTLPVCGIKNNHYFCYLNTGMQCLLSIGEFVYYFANKQYLTIKHQTKKKLWCGCTTRTIKALENGKELEELEELLEGRFKKTQQHDCHEFMRYYLEMLQEEMNPVVGVGDRKGKTSEEVYSHYLAGHTSIVDYLFAGQLTNLTKCSGCENLSLIHDPFMELVLDIKDTLEISMGRYFGLEKLADLYECERCHTKNKATRQLFISKTPAYLLVFVKRFVNMKKKVTDIMEYPHKLNLDKYVRYSAGPTQYQLLSVIVHKGSLQKGHYYCLTRRSNKWYYLNDQLVKQLPFKDVLQQQAYLLIYERQK